GAERRPGPAARGLHQVELFPPRRAANGVVPRLLADGLEVLEDGPWGIAPLPQQKSLPPCPPAAAARAAPRRPAAGGGGGCGPRRWSRAAASWMISGLWRGKI